MRIHRVRGRNLQEALERARSQHGESAVVLSQESAADGEVWLAVSERRAAANVVFPRVETRPERAASPRAAGAAVASERGAGDVRARLERSQVSPELRERVLAAVRASGALGAFAIDAAAAELARTLRVAPSPRAGGRMRALAFVGPNGVGKTTTLAKLAVRLVRAGRRVALVTTDVQRAGAAEQLRAYGELLQSPVHVARDGEELAALAAASSHLDALLIDTTGRSPADAAALERLGRALESARARAPLETYLVLAASASRESLGLAAAAFAAAQPAAAILTKLDETRAVGPAVETASSCGSGLLFLCDGQDVSAHLQRAGAESCADLVLRGRLS